MIGEIGHFCLIVALMLALAQGVPAWMAVAQPAAQGQFLFVALAAAFVGNNFTLLVIGQHSNTALPTPYRIAAIWGGHEGSMLRWLLMLGARISRTGNPTPQSGDPMGTLGPVKVGSHGLKLVIDGVVP